MDVDGVWASLHYPSLIAGFCGSNFSRCSDPDLGLACVRAWNDWHLDEWVGPRTDRFIPLQLPWLSDPEVAAAEVRRNAERGFRAVSFLEQPVDMGLPSLHTDHWDPFLRACEETGTVVCLHCASSGWSASRSPYAPLELLTTLFPVNALVTCADWLWSGVPVRFPRAADLPGRVRHRLGADADQPHRLRDGPLGDRVCSSWADPRRATRPRCCARPSGSG